jgi:dihydrofolate synthase/folylpolyglutamate synthase
MSKMNFITLKQWLNWQSSLHPTEIELGLERVSTVAKRLNLLPPPFPIITVAGTNGKGSSIILLDTILSTAGYHVGRFMSPHLLCYNERICVSGVEVSDTQICQAFEFIEKVRGDISLTYFEFSTIAAMLIFQHNQVDIALLEVGLGGRLDAVNIFDADIALVTAIDIDHTAWLGDDRESIGFEKAGIFRPDCPAVCSDTNPPQSLMNYAEHLKTPLYYLGYDFSYLKTADKNPSWQMTCHLKSPPLSLINKKKYQYIFSHLPLPNLAGDFQLQNAAGVLMVLALLSERFPVLDAAIHQGLTHLILPGRFQIFKGRVTRILDVTHNPLGAKVLAELLHQHPCEGETHAVVGMLDDKDITSVLTIMQNSIDHWHVAPLDTPRSADVDFLIDNLTTLGITLIYSYSSIQEAYEEWLAYAPDGDRIVVFGSFYAVAEALQVEKQLDQN